MLRAARNHPWLTVALLALFSSLVIAVAWKFRYQLYTRTTSLYPSETLRTSYAESCLEPGPANPAWECYELTTDTPPGQPVTVTHAATGEVHRTLTFSVGGASRFRFTPSRTGLWTVSTGGEVRINQPAPDYAAGFLGAAGQSWQRTATGAIVVPQYVMYDGADLDDALREFVVEHGFSGFHVTNLRDFLVNPSYFEALVLKTYRLGGTTHFWIWGDASRRLTPDTYGVDVDRLYREIGARLGPLPGWSVGFGFDLHEWASAAQVEVFRARLHEITSYRHMVGARGYKNRYLPISTKLDYASWEWHRPSFTDYIEHLAHANDIPAFSEDRFRIREPSRYPNKDYDAEDTLVGLWESALAGGVANIWGYKPRGAGYSQPYPIKRAIRTYRTFIDRYYGRPVATSDVVAGGECLETAVRHLCFLHDRAGALDIQTDHCRVTAVDARTAYREWELTSGDGRIQLPHASAWALVIDKPGTTECA